jgi:subtilase family serine protease
MKTYVIALWYLRWILTAVLVLAPILFLAPNALSAESVPLIVHPVDENQRIVLSGNAPIHITPEVDRGAVDDSFPLNGIQLQLRRSPEREQAAETLADDLERAGAGQFHHWLTANQYAEQFGVAPEDIATIREWLRSHGFTVLAQSPSRMTIDFSGTAGQIREAFGTEIHALETHGERHIANLGDPSIPAALAPAIEGIVSLNDFRPHSMVVHRPQYTFPVDGFEFWGIVPADLATIYHFNPLFSAGITGQGQTIALIEDSDVYNPGDWETFRKTFGLTSYPGGSFTTVHPGECPDPGVAFNELEAIIDAEWASAAAPSANLVMASCADTTTVFGGLIALQSLVNQPEVPAIISFSYGACEAQDGATFNAAYKAAYLQAVLEGVSIFVASADNGAAACDFTGSPAQAGIAVNGFASTAYNVAVGGTDFGDTYAGTTADYWAATNRADYASAESYVPEIPWNDTCASTLISSYLGYKTPYGPSGFCANASEYFLEPAGGSGGPSNCAKGASDGNYVTGVTPANGTCQGWKKPAWQVVLGNPNDGVRDLPDVSMFAADGVWNHAYVACDTDPADGAPCMGAPANWSFGGGTSFATPIMAGMQALVNQVWGGRQGNPDPIYYALARQEYGTQGRKDCESFAAGGPAFTCTFNDVTLGDNDVDCIGSYNCYAPGAPGAIGVLSLSDTSYKPAYRAGVGWDFTTGIGTVNAPNLVLNPIWLLGAP